jgi:N6-adenosine-specific RNA methylase IME4
MRNAVSLFKETETDMSTIDEFRVPRELTAEVKAVEWQLRNVYHDSLRVNDGPRELVLMTRAEQVLAEARTIDEVMNIRDKAQAAKAYARKARLSKEIVLHASIIKVQAERRLGEMLSRLPLPNSAPGNQYTGKLVRSQNATGPIRLRDLGITKSDSSRAQQIAGLPVATFNRYVQQCVESGHEPSTAGLLRLAKQEKVQKTVVSTSELPDRFFDDLGRLIATGQRFATIYADPPWQYDNQATRAAASNHYPTLTLEQIAAEPIAQLAADNCHLHLWTTNGFLPAAFSVIEAWGFEYKSCFVWVKPTLGIGNYWRVSHELLLFAIKGNLPFRDRGQRSWLELERQGHSRKPEAIRTLIEKVSHGPFLELYGRAIPPNRNWTVYGNQLVPRTGQSKPSIAKRPDR